MTHADDTVYARHSPPWPGFPELAGTHDADVCVVGGGLAGLSVAFELARLGRAVTLVEARSVGWGASGRNGGFVGPGYSLSLTRLERRVGAEPAAALYRLSMEGVDIVREHLAATAGYAVASTGGVLNAVRYDPGDALARYRDRMAHRFGRELELLSTASLASRLHTQRYGGALLDRGSFHLDPLAYTRGLAGRCSRFGVRLHERTPALGVDLAAPVKTVRTPSGIVQCRHVVFAGGGYTDNLFPRLRRSVLPIATYVMVTRPDADRVHSAINTDAGVTDDRRAGDYYRLVDGGRRILWGGRITTRTTPPRRLGDLLARSMVDTYPQLAGLTVDMAWSGLMAYARHQMPQLGSLGQGAWACTGFGGHGINTTAIGGRLVAEAIAGVSDRVMQFAPFGLAWNGGMAGRAAAQLTYWWLQAADRVRERGALPAVARNR